MSARRLESIDVVRGLVIALMVLDHTVWFFESSRLRDLDPLDLDTTTPLRFATRWITHLCAPAFVFLAGVSAWLSGARAASRRAQSRFLLTRGLWLVALDLTVVAWFGWQFEIDPFSLGLRVLWALGVSMIVLAGLIHLPRAAIAGFGLVLVLGHNLLDGLAPQDLGGAADLWRVLHVPGMFRPSTGLRVWVQFPLIPWIGVIALGYAFAPLLTAEPTRRRRWMLGLGAGALGLFVALRLSNLYGDPEPWITQATALDTVLAFIDCEKYPPSLCFLLVTLGPMLLALAALDRGTPRALRPALAFGAVPLFAYLLHLPLVHGMAVLAFAMAGRPPAVGFGLGAAYLAWLIALAALYPLCRWFAAVKQRGDRWWLRYL